jgi:hypothetical protein
MNLIAKAALSVVAAALAGALALEAAGRPRRR